MDNILPQIVKFTNNDLLPINVKDKYFINYTINGTINLPATIYININSRSKIGNFIDAIKQDYNILFIGSDNFILDEDYYISESLKDTYEGEVTFNWLPNYYKNGSINYDYFYETNIDTFLDYCVTHNNAIDSEFTEEELLSFYSTFCNIILTYASYDTAILVNNIYYKVLNYFANFKSDDTLIGMQMILNTNIQTEQPKQSCGCATIGNTTEAVCTENCSSYYINSMLTYIKQMLGNIDFYKNWFYINDENNNKIVNTTLLYLLKTLINDLLNLGISLNTDKIISNACNCPVVDNNNDSCNRTIISKYLDVLLYVENDEIDDNSNKIKVYGESFGELLPKLQF